MKLKELFRIARDASRWGQPQGCELFTSMSFNKRLVALTVRYCCVDVDIFVTKETDAIDLAGQLDRAFEKAKNDHNEKHKDGPQISGLGMVKIPPGMAGAIDGLIQQLKQSNDDPSGIEATLKRKEAERKAAENQN